MTPVLWAAFGMTVGTAVLYVALGLPRPFDRTHLSFACIMVMVVAYAFFEAQLDRATTTEFAVETVRKQVVAAHGLIAAVLVFVPAYTQVRVPRWIMFASGSGLAILFIANLIVPYSIWFSAKPHLVTATFDDVTYSVLVGPPPSVLQYTHAVYVMGVFALTFTCALKQIRRGERRRGLVLALSLVIVIVQHVVDIVREASGATWPYSDEFGFVAWSVFMSVQLAIEYRSSAQHLRATLAAAEQHATELARTAEAALHVRDKLNTPLQTLEMTLAVREPRASDDQHTLAELRDAVSLITQLSLAVERTTEHPSALAALERAS